MPGRGFSFISRRKLRVWIPSFPRDDVVQVDTKARARRGYFEAIQSARAWAAKAIAIQTEQRSPAGIFEQNLEVCFESPVPSGMDVCDATAEVSAPADKCDNPIVRSVGDEHGSVLQVADADRVASCEDAARPQFRYVDRDQGCVSRFAVHRRQRNDASHSGRRQTEGNQCEKKPCPHVGIVPQARLARGTGSRSALAVACPRHRHTRATGTVHNCCEIGDTHRDPRSEPRGDNRVLSGGRPNRSMILECSEEDAVSRC